MKLADVIHNFKVKSITPVNELSATVYEMEHLKSGATLAWIDRDEEIKSFVIGFKTIPEDDTGAFHILEHSVLSSNEKYPLKELFIELIKGTLNSVMDAFTSIDHTAYLFSTRNDKEYLNLVDMEMNCVLHPGIFSTPYIFMQEGWHHELHSKDEAPIYKGVVFNEVKGAFSVPQAVLMKNMNKLLFPDVCYSKNSGGDPACVPDLTYEQFLDCHRRYYHPSNCCIALDGRIEIEKVLKLLDESHLCNYDRQVIPAAIELQPEISPVDAEYSYSIGANEPTENRCFFAQGYLLPGKTDKQTCFALDVLSEYLAGSSEAPLCRAINESGLAQSISMRASSFLQSYVLIMAENGANENKDAVKSLIRDTLAGIAAEGLDAEKLEAAFNKVEFSKRRSHTEHYAGINNCSDLISSWLYGDPAAEGISYNDALCSLREKLSEGYFEKLIEDAFLNNPQNAFITAVPSTTLALEIQEKENARLMAEKASWSEEKLQQVIDSTKDLISWQQIPNTPELLATLPQLELSAISKKAVEKPITCEKAEGVNILLHPISASGLIHASLYFNAADLSLEELPYLALLSDLLGKLPTEAHSSERLQTLLSISASRLEIKPEFYAKPGTVDICRAMLAANFTLLSAKADEGAALIKEVLCSTLFNDLGIIKNGLLRALSGYRAALNGRGIHSAPTVRARAYGSAEGVALEYTEGYEYYCWAKKQLEAFDANAEELSAKLSALAKKLLVKSRLTVSIAGEKADSRFVSLAASLPEGESAAELACYKPLGSRAEGILTSAAVSCSNQYANLAELGASYNGKLTLLAQIVSMNYLWQMIRMQGGAYGGGLDIFPNGDVIFNAFRDPTPARSLDCFSNSESFVKEFMASEASLNKHIIGAVPHLEPIMGPISMLKDADTDYFMGISYEDNCRVREELLSATKEDILECCKLLKAVCEKNAICVTGGQKHIDTCAGKLDAVLEL